MVVVNGPLKSDDIGLFRKIIQEYVDRRLDQILIGQELIPVQKVNALDVIITYPDAEELVAQKVGEFASADYKHITWNDLKGSLDKYMAEVMVSDETIHRQLEQIMVNRNLELAVQSIQVAEDKEIFSELKNSVANTVAATAAWNLDTADIGKDIATALEWIYDNARVGNKDPITIAMPAPVMPHLMRHTISGTDTPLIEYINSSFDVFNIRFLKTYELTNSALVVVNSPATAIHYRFNAPEVEEERVPARGYKFYVTHYFKTFVIPNHNRIVEITGVR